MVSLLEPPACKIVISRDVIFAENELQREQESIGNAEETTMVYMDDKSREKNSFEAEPMHDEQEPNEVRRTSWIFLLNC